MTSHSTVKISADTGALLLVGEAPPWALRFVQVLTSAGHRVLRVAGPDGVEAVLTGADGVRVGLVLLDAAGAPEAVVAAVRALRALPPIGRCPVVLVQTSMPPAALAAALDAGACDWVLPECPAAELEARVTARLGRADEPSADTAGHPAPASGPLPMGQGAFEVDLTTGIATFSAECAALLGDAPVRFSASPTAGLERLHPDDRPATLATWRAHLAAETPALRVVARFRSERGDWRWLLILGRVADRGPEGDPRSFVGTLTDIDDLKRAELALRRSERTLCEAQRLAHMGSFEYSVEADRCAVTEPLRELFGIDETHPTDFDGLIALVSSDDRERVSALVRHLCEHGGRAELEHRLVRPKDGVVRSFRGFVEAEVDEAGKVVRLAGTEQDITELRRLETALRHALKMQAIGQLAGGVAHDFNNLLSVILMNASMLRKARILDAEYATDLEQIIEAGRRASTLTRQLLAFSRREPVEAVALDLNEVIGEVARMLQRVIGEDIRVAFAPMAGGAPIVGDPGLIEQIAMNLAMNAREAMPAGGQLTIGLSARHRDDAPPLTPAGPPRSGEFLCLSMSDAGVGIPPEVLPHLFEPFFTTKEVGQGSGLGLATVHGIVQQHGGWLEVETQVGAGTTVHTFFPRATEAPPTLFQSTGAMAHLGRGRTVLLVEDEPPVRALVRRVLESAGFRVVEAPTGAAALSLWPGIKGSVSLLLTDVIMPDGVTGGQLAAHLQAASPELPVVFMTGYPEEVAARGGSLTAHTVLHKPFLPDALLVAVRNTLGDL